MAKNKSSKKDLNDNSIDDVIKSINKQYGDGSIQYGDTSVVVPCNTFSTGAMTLDAALGIMGVPRGRIVEIYGPESSGKTTLALSIIAEAQKTGSKVAFIDAEHALDKNWAKNIGIDIQSLLISQPDSGEQALEICELMVRSRKFGVIVVDSVAALTPQAEIDGEMGDSSIGAQARLISQAMRKLAPSVSKTDTCLIFINQIRMKIGVMFGSPETTPGGRALKFYSTVRIDVRKTGTLKSGDHPIGQSVKAKIIKNKVAPPFEQATYNIYFGKADYPVYGIDSIGSILSAALEHDIISKSGSWYSYNDIRLGNGEPASAQFLRENTDITNEIKNKIVQTIQSVQSSPNINPAANEDEEDVNADVELGFDEQ